MKQREPLDVIRTATSVLRACALEEKYGRSCKVNREAIQTSIGELEMLASAYIYLRQQCGESHAETEAAFQPSTHCAPR